MAVQPTTGPTLGLEEELHVCDLASGDLRSSADDLLAALSTPATTAGLTAAGTVVAELPLSQIETVTGVGSSIEDLLGRALTLRAAAAGAATELGLGLLASGSPPLGRAADQRVSPDSRYDALRERAAALVDQQLIAGMHLHVGVGDPTSTAVDDEARVAVVEALRPWLPALLALTANSPYWLGTDTGFASYRQVHWQRWPVAGPPPSAQDAAQWHRSVAALVDAGVVDDASFVYWDVRLATRFPTVEVRVADVVPTLDDAAGFVAIVRGLAAGALAEHEAGRRAPGVRLSALRAATWRAARYGLAGQLVDPATGTLAPAVDVLRSMLRHAAPGLEIAGDGDLARDGLARVFRDGNGADRQRRAFERFGWEGVLDVVRVDPDASTPTVTSGDGNGWVACTCGQQHWGLHGAAGLLLTRPGAAGPEVLLQLRAAWTHQGGTWGLPGGARDSHETTGEAARREAWEEAGVEPGAVTVLGEDQDDHGPWSYTYVLARADDGVAASPTNRESDAVEWVPVPQVDARELHPAFAAAWPRLRTRLVALAEVRER
ncbi:glutamate--cysteine ligase [Angustibacter luteus]|uniref:Putative glutamate--cysteine ligase 2 n=1 Tax=Angustibacter luteus TaxID=658456 RepID=A0ABW1JB67_9ACTN